MYFPYGTPYSDNTYLYGSTCYKYLPLALHPPPPPSSSSYYYLTLFSPSSPLQISTTSFLSFLSPLSSLLLFFVTPSLPPLSLCLSLTTLATSRHLSTSALPTTNIFLLGLAPMATTIAHPPSAIAQAVQAFADSGEQLPQPYSSQSSLTPPDSDPSTPNNNSPASPRSVWSLPTHLQLQTKQLRTPRVPMYVPAVLRPTEKPIRQSPPKPGQHTNASSPDSRRNSVDVQPSTNQRPPTLRRMVTEEWNDDMVAAVTGPPSRNHWKVSNISILF